MGVLLFHVFIKRKCHSLELYFSVRYVDVM